MTRTISQLISRCESGDKSHALRTEPAYRITEAGFSLVKKFNPGWSRATYDAVLRMSWGAYQIMGDNLYIQGLAVSLADFWNSPEEQLNAFNRYVKARKIDFPLSDMLQWDAVNKRVITVDRAKLEVFARRYNGSVLYADRMIEIFRQMNLED